jgi:hypothetical protein
MEPENMKKKESVMDTKDRLDFEEYEETPKREGDVPKATITKAGNIAFNKKFRDEHWEDLQGDFIVFRYDRKNRVIGLKAVLSPLHNSYPIREVNDGKGLVISARAFLKHYEIDFKKSRSYAVQVDRFHEDSGPLIILDLKQGKHGSDK